MRATLLAVSATLAAATQVNLDAPALDMDLINRINANPASTWTAGINTKFSDMTLRQAQRLLGAKMDSPLWAAKYGALEKKVVPVPDALPASFNSTANWPACADVIGHIRDQSDCGCCWAFGSTEAFNDRLCIVHNVTTLMSVGETCACCDPSHGCSGSNGCDGGFPTDAFDYFASKGLVSGGDNLDTGKGDTCFPFPLKNCDHHEGGPYTPCPNLCPGGECNTPTCPANKCSESTYPTPWAQDKHFGKKPYTINGVQQIMADIVANGPVSAAFTVFADFLTYKTGVYTHQSGAALGGHAVKIIGYGTEGGVDYWLVANSWNNYWGDFGSFKIKRGTDECGIEDSIATTTV